MRRHADIYPVSPHESLIWVCDLQVARAEENKANLGAITEDEEEEEVGGNDKAGLTAAQQAEEGTLPLARSGV
jgi:hypothetical protein